MIIDERQRTSAVEQVIDAVLAERTSRARIAGTAYQLLWERIRSASAGGKRIRPRLVLLAHQELSGAGNDAASHAADAVVTAAAAFELLHTALLVHDDVLDKDLVRRGTANLQGSFVADAIDSGLPAAAATRWGDAAGLLAGDLLISAVHALIAETRLPTLHALVDECLFITAAGEFADIGLALGALDATPDDIVRMMRHKTAAYSFAAPLQAGALLAGASDDVQEHLAQIGTLLGFIYQLRDDLLGVFGKSERLGKPVDGDLREGKRTLLIAHAEGTEAWGEVEHLFGRRSLDSDDAERLRAALISSGARARTEELLERCTREACERIEAAPLPQGLKHELLQLAHHCVERES